MLIVEDQAYFDEVVEFAKRIEKYESKGREDGNVYLKNRLDYLDNYGGVDAKGQPRSRVRLSRDTVHSFYFVIEVRNDRDTWTRLFDGGLLWHGPVDGFGSGMAPSYAVTMAAVHGWHIHT